MKMLSLCKPIYREQGTALVFSLLILLIMTIVGVAALSNTQMQERMAGNVNVQSLAFEAASAGIGEALAYGMSRWDARDCNRDDGGWDDDGYSDPRALSLDTDAVQQLSVQYLLKADCLEDPGFTADPTDPLFTPPPVQMYVTSLGVVSAADGSELASREIEVRIDDFRADGLSALRVEGDATVLFDPANSRQFIVDGNGGAAISTSNFSNAESIVQEIADVDRLGNYRGGVARSDYDPPFDSASQVARFALEIRAFLEAHNQNIGAPGTAPLAACNPVTFPESQEAAFSDFIEAVGGTPYVPELRFIDGDFNINGGTDFDGLTYVTGDLDMGPVSGSGLLIVEGNVEWHGNADFTGLVIGLGGEFAFNGLGNGTTRGMIYIANVALPNLTGSAGGKYATDIRDAWSGQSWLWVLQQFDLWLDPENVETFAEGDLIDTDHPDGFGSTTIDFAGGGNHTMTYSCALFDGWRQVLSNCGIEAHTRPESAGGLDNIGLAEPWGDSGCGIPGRGGTIQAIRSWRENLGWRELLEGST